MFQKLQNTGGIAPKKKKKSETGGRGGGGDPREVLISLLCAFTTPGGDITFNHWQMSTGLFPDTHGCPAGGRTIHLNSAKSPLNRTGLHVSIRAISHMFPLLIAFAIRWDETGINCNCNGGRTKQSGAASQARQKTDKKNDTRCWQSSHKFGLT